MGPQGLKRSLSPRGLNKVFSGPRGLSMLCSGPNGLNMLISGPHGLNMKPRPIQGRQACEKTLRENLIPNLVDKDNTSLQLRDITSLPTKMGGLNIKLPSDFENLLEWSFKRSSVLDIYDPLTAISEQENVYTKIKILKTERIN